MNITKINYLTLCLLHSLATPPEYRKVQVKEGTKANMHPQLAVKGIGYDRLLGGFEIESRLQHHLAKVFEVCQRVHNSICGNDLRCVILDLFASEYINITENLYKASITLCVVRFSQLFTQFISESEDVGED